MEGGEDGPPRAFLYASLGEVREHALGAYLVQFVDGHEGRAVQRRGNPRGGQDGSQQLAVIEPDDEVREPELDQRIGHCGAQLGLDRR